MPNAEFLSFEDIEPILWPSIRPSHGSAWHGHVSFAHWIVQAMRPRTVVELGTQNGVSYAAFCNAVAKLGLPTKCFAVDTWQGDLHAGAYDDRVYQDLYAFNLANFSSFSTLLRCYFEEALGEFSEASIDLLHIDGLHTYEAAKHDFDTWRPKLSSSAVVLFHDTDIYERGFGVWRLWEELSTQYPHFKFSHWAGLGVLAVGTTVAPKIIALCAGWSAAQADTIRGCFAQASRVAHEYGLVEFKRANTRKKPMVIGPLGINIALNKTAFQSSYFPGLQQDSSGAVNGIKDGTFGFHTDFEERAWWMLDLGSPSRFDQIVIYNRMDENCKARSASLSVMISRTGLDDWTTLYDHNGGVFGGIDGNPLQIECNATVARFVRIQLRETNYLHLDEVEIYVREHEAA